MTRTGSWVLAGLFGVLLSACSGGVSQTGTGGAAPQDPRCPMAAPEGGAECSGSLTCSYAVCDGQTHVTATCANSVWSVPVTAGCAPLTAPSACKPYGTWHVESDLMGSDAGYPDDFDLVIVKTAEGIPLVTGPTWAELSPDGCKLHASWVLESWTDPTDESTSLDYTQDLELTFSGDIANGTLSRSCVGECAGDLDESVPATAKRTAP